MQKYMVTLSCSNGHKVDPIIVEAGNSQKAIELAISMMDMQANAKRQSLTYTFNNVRAI